MYAESYPFMYLTQFIIMFVYFACGLHSNFPCLLRTNKWFRFLTREVSCSLTQHTLSQASQLQVCSVESLPEVVIQGLFFAVQQYGGAPVHDSLRGSLHHQQVARVVGIFRLVDGHLGCKRKLACMSGCQLDNHIWP